MTRKNINKGYGLNYSYLAKVFQKITANITNGIYGKLNSLIIYKKDEKLLESYFNGYNNNSLHEFQSVTKSIQAILVGIALKEKFISSIDLPIKDFFPEYKHLNWSGGKDKISIRHLLNMTAGFDWNEGTVPYLSLQNHSNMMAWSEDWIAFALEKTMLYNPGEKFLYSSANPILLSAILNKVTGMNHESFAKKYLYNPLDIRYYNYHRSVFDDKILADVEMCPADMAKIGLLVRNKGVWKGNQVVDTAWINEMLNEQTDIQDESDKYGFCWWLQSINYLNKRYNLYYAWGYGSQHIFIIPEISLVMICTGKNYNINKHSGPFRLLRNEILPVFV